MKDRFPNGWVKPEFNELGDTKYGWRVLYRDKLNLGNKTDIGYATLINAKNGITIGENTEVGPHCSIMSDNTIGATSGPVVIGKDCLIGAYSTIMPNVTIEDGIRIPAYSYVDKNVTHEDIIRENRFLLTDINESMTNWSLLKVVKILRKILN